MTRVSLAVLITCGLGCASGAATPTPVTSPSARQAQAPSSSNRRSADKPKPYREVITEQAMSDSGLFIVHRVDDTYYYEIPDSAFGRDMLLISRIARTPSNLSPFLNAGSKVAEQVVQWEKRDNRVMLRKVSYNAVANDTLPVYQSVVSNNFAPIIRSFDVEALTYTVPSGSASQ